jgi:hypothetical protein
MNFFRPVFSFKLGILIIIFQLIRFSLFSQIVINEIMPVPTGDEPEWIELFNFSDSSYTLNGIFLKDASTSKLLPVFTISAKGYAVLTKDTASLLLTRKIPQSAVLIELKMPIFNNDYDVLTLKKSDGILLDSIYYNMSWGQKGISLERYNCLKIATNSDNWKPSKSQDSASAGSINSVTPVENDLAINSILINKQNEFEIEIQNAGTNPVENAFVYIFTDKDGDSIFTSQELFARQDIPKLDSGQTHLIKYTREAVKEFSGKTSGLLCLATINYQFDQRSKNDTLIGKVSFSPPQGSILINEFMYNPLSECGEFVELYNASDEVISLQNWVLHDRSTSKGYDSILIGADFIIKPYDYVVLCWDSSFFTCYPQLAGSAKVYFKKSVLNLNVSGDDIVLLDGNGNLQDWLSYFDNWNSKAISETKGKSLEKISPTITSSQSMSWTTCVDSLGATPSLPNSVSQQITFSSGITAEPNPFSPFGNSKHPFCVISYQLPYIQSYLTAKIFDLDGTIVRELSNADLVPEKGNLTWDGRNDKGYTMQVGGYVLLVEAKDISSDNVHREKLLLVIGQ